MYQHVPVARVCTVHSTIPSPHTLSQARSHCKDMQQHLHWPAYSTPKRGCPVYASCKSTANMSRHAFARQSAPPQTPPAFTTSHQQQTLSPPSPAFSCAGLTTMLAGMRQMPASASTTDGSVLPEGPSFAATRPTKTQKTHGSLTALS